MRLAVVPVVLTLVVAPLRAQGTATSGAPGAAPAPAPAPALCTSPTHAAAAHELVAMTGAEQQVKQSSEAMIDMQFRASPQMAELFGDVIRAYVGEQMAWSTLEPEFVRIYCDLFTEEDLRGLIAFNRTPLGQKILKSTPELVRRSMAVGEARIQANMPEFQKRMEERATKLRAEGKLPD